MRIGRPNIPHNTDADVAMSVVIPCINERTRGEVTYSYEFEGVADRTASGDVLSVDIKNRNNATSSVKFSLKRDSLYHILPEFLFHPLDRYSGTIGDVAEFDKRYKEQEDQEKSALAYFKFFDKSFQELKVNYQLWLNENIFKGNHFLSDFIISGYSVNRDNPYIKAVLPCLPWLRGNRGNREMTEVALGYAFAGNATVTCEWRDYNMELNSDVHSTLSGTLTDMHCGATFHSGSYLWLVCYQTKLDTEERLNELKGFIEDFSAFFCEWFLNVEDKLKVEFGDWEASPVLTETIGLKGIFLNYSTQLI